ncbi:basement membrane-specific heparan sulfate proteoglycan core protein-like [Topomyia yanbarensis]|uniref:basement membrane-specific heparan sulfate proteoglycan core protein-like n=1 Tax=Topomyia yanbarensis TaxID=2498891 RepID=UPI00273B5696|nr:basement membrane-specific heparan sulfate proteoglycan core protein-like [Topomyia yanbarensis]
MSLAASRIFVFLFGFTLIVLAVAENPSNITIVPSKIYRDSVCGSKFEARIGYGDAASEGQWPWHGALFYGNDYICGCTLISEWFVLTAAHCVFNPETESRFNLRLLRVSLGLHSLDRLENSTREYKLAAAKVYPLFALTNHKHDVALLLLANRVELGDFIYPISVGFSEPAWIEHLAGYSGTVVGWGFTEADAVSNVLMTAQMPIVRYTDCVESNPDLFGRLIHNGMYCAGALNGTSVCNGDSGGGMYVYQNGGWYLRGVVSFSATRSGTNLCDLYSYAGFVNVQYYANWIRQQLKDHEKGLNQTRAAKSNESVLTRFETENSIPTNPAEITTTERQQIIPEGSPVDPVRPECLQHHSVVITVDRDSSVSLLCRHEPDDHIYSIRWFRRNEYNQIVDISSELGFANDSIHDILTLRHLDARHSGRYFCRVRSRDRESTDNRTLAVTGVVPRFVNNNQSSFMKFLLSFKLDYFNLKVSFKAEKSDGIIFTKIACGEQISTLTLVNNRVVFQFRTSRGTIRKLSSEDHFVRSGQWHTIQISNLRDRGYFSLDNRLLALFRESMYTSNCDEERVYLGGAPGKNSTGFTGCISTMVLNDHLIDLWKEPIDIQQVTQCYPCSNSPCANGGVCIETSDSDGLECLCNNGFVGKYCTHRGESCDVQTCNEGFCDDFETGFKCFCPANRSGKRCEREYHLGSKGISFDSSGFAQYRLNLGKDFSMQFSFTPHSVERSMLAYLIGENRGISNFLALVIADGRLELRFSMDLDIRVNSLKSTVLLEKAVPYRVNFGYRNEFVFFAVNDEPESLKSIFGDLLSTSDYGYSLYLGGQDRHTVWNRCPDIERGFDGCIAELNVDDEIVNLTTGFVDARNIANCE